MKTVVFIGHNECYEMFIEKLESTIISCIENGATHFISGGQGGFDRICAGTVNRLKGKYPFIKNLLVIPYLSFNIFDKELFDEVIYPDGFEKYYFKAAIIEKNKYMVDNSQIAICYVKREYGGAYKTYTYAKKKNLEIINLA